MIADQREHNQRGKAHLFGQAMACAFSMKARCRGFIAFASFVAVVIVADLVLPPPLQKAEALSPLIIDREDRWLHAFTTKDGRWRFAADIETIDPLFVERLIAIEDKRFYRHFGVDPAATLRASVDAIKSRRIRSGASTITMQTARLLEPRPRNLGSKLVEMARAIQIERRLSKREILELYLTLAPYGGNVEGVRAASLVYFDKEPRRLTNAEQALLIALPQAPEARRPDRRQRAAKEARAEILLKLVGSGHLGRQYADEAAEAVLPSARSVFPRAAYHAASSLANTGEAVRGVTKTSLDLLIQREAERLAAAHAGKTKDGAIASLLIVDHETMQVRASVGSSGLDKPGGWIDLTTAVRSPGSTLKPLIYAMAFEDGLAGPETLIDDMPRAFGDYSPENFSRTFSGEVRIREALQHSLNVPAVSALDQIGAPRFAAMLNAAGIELKGARKANKREGLALALGGAGLTARDMAMLYAGLANGGNITPLVWHQPDGNKTDILEPEFDDVEKNSYQLFSAQNAARVSAILRDAPALSGRAPSMLSTSAPRIAFKTGTSYGFRDAWSAGHAGRYTVVAWVGRADGAPRPGVTGRKAAAPLLFDIFDMLARFENDRGIDLEADETEAPSMVRFAPKRVASPPEIVFPRSGVELYASQENQSRGFSLAARGGVKSYRWYVEGEPVSIDQSSGRAIWYPARGGFYDVTVIDGEGRQAKSKVRVHLAG